MLSGHTGQILKFTHTELGMRRLERLTPAMSLSIVARSNEQTCR
jgi:hypothetical protein